MSYSDGDGRPPIPADLRRRILVEAGHRCAIPTCRYIEIDVHHIIPWATCQTHDYDNLIALCPNCHRRADSGAIDRKSLRLYKFNLRFAHDKFSQLELDVIFELGAAPPGNAIFWMPYALLLLKRALDARLISADRHPNISINAGGMDQTPILLTLTERGRAFLDDLGLVEL